MISNCTNLAYSTKVMFMPILPKFKVPQMELYDGSQDPVDHLENFKPHMTLHVFSREVAC